MNTIERYANGKKRYSSEHKLLAGWKCRDPNRVKEWKRNAPEVNKRFYLKKKLSNPQYYLWLSAKRRAKEKGLQFTISLSDIVIPDVCPILGIPIFIKHEVATNSLKRNNPNSPSLDRIRHELGYTKENIQVISWRANNLKSDATFEEMRLITEFLRKRDM